MQEELFNTFSARQCCSGGAANPARKYLSITYEAAEPYACQATIGFSIGETAGNREILNGVCRGPIGSAPREIYSGAPSSLGQSGTRGVGADWLRSRNRDSQTNLPGESTAGKRVILHPCLPPASNPTNSGIDLKRMQEGSGERWASGGFFSHLSTRFKTPRVWEIGRWQENCDI